MSCAEFAADLSAWIDRELPASRAAAVAAHVAACAACRARVEAQRHADAELRAIPLREMPPRALAEVLQRTARGEPRRAPLSRTRLLRWVAAPAAAAAGLALYLATRTDPLDSASPEDLAVAIDLDTVEDLDVIANLEVLEAILALEEAGLMNRRTAAAFALALLGLALAAPVAAEDREPPRPDLLRERWLERHPMIRERVEQRRERRTLDVNERRALRARVLALPPQERRALRDRIDRYRALAPAERDRIRANAHRFRDLPPTERERLRAAWRRLREMPAGEREAILDKLEKAPVD